MWGYLGEFWDSIAEVVVSAGTYTIEWFQSIGNAVAGAIGGLFSDLIHHIYDVFYTAWWVLDGLQALLAVILAPLTWIFNFGKGFIYTAFKTAEELDLVKGDITTFSDNVQAVFSAIPYVNYIFSGVGVVLTIIFLVFIIKQLANV